MNLLEKRNRTLKGLFPGSADTFFGRTIEDILDSNFFDSFDTHILEQQDSYRLEMAVPGLTRKDLTVDVDGRIMSVSARRKTENQSWRSVESGRHLRRSFVLPLDADTNNIKAKCLHGLLTIRIGKVRPEGVHRVIQVSGKPSGLTASQRIASRWTRLLDKAKRLLQPLVV